MRHIPYLVLIYIWLLAGRSDPGGLLQHLPVIRWITYILVPFLLAIVFIVILSRGKYKTTVIDSSLIALLILLSISTYINNAGINDFLHGIGVYLRYPILYIIFCNIETSTNSAVHFLKMFLFVTLLLLIESVFNFFLFGKHTDHTFFTLGITWGTRNAGILFTAFVCLLTAHAALKSWNFRHSVLLLFIVISSFIASIRSTLVFLPFIIIIVYGVHKRLVGTRLLVVMLIASVTLVFLGSAIDLHAAFSSISLLDHFNPGYRLDYIHQVILRVTELDNLLFGTGPRSMKPGTIDSAGMLYADFLASNKSIVALGSNQFVKGIAELGIAGMLVYWYMLFRILQIASSNWIYIRFLPSIPLWIKVINLSFFGLWSYYASFGLISNDLWRMDASSFIFWYFAAVITVFHKNLLINITVENQPFKPAQSGLNY